MSQQQPLKQTAAPIINISKEDPEKLYQLVEVIGTGSYGEVFKVCSESICICIFHSTRISTGKGRNKNTGEVVAVKVIKLEPGEDLMEVLNEVIFLQSCRNKNIVNYGGCYMKRGNVKNEKQIWIVMEFCGGGSVEALYKSKHHHALFDGLIPENEHNISISTQGAASGSGNLCYNQGKSVGSRVSAFSQ